MNTDNEKREDFGVWMMRRLGLEPDPWQLEVLERKHKRLLLNCCRQAGKSTVVAMLSLVEALKWNNAVILLLSRSQRQSTELFRTVADFYQRMGEPHKRRLTGHELELTSNSRIVSLPCQADTIRGYSRVHMLVIDEAARVPDDLYRSVRPMLAVSDGTLVCLSTPYGKRGFFYESWSKGGDDWARIEVPAALIPRITPEFLRKERRALGTTCFVQEYCCSFEAMEGLVYPEFRKCVVQGISAPAGRLVGGIDFGLREPLAAVWGVLDKDDVLWISGEHYVREKPLSYHARFLPRDATWYGDPAGAREICELRCAGFCIQKADNAVVAGIGAVQARMEDGRLKVLGSACPNLLAESELYIWDPNKKDEPAKDNDHALDALRYLIYKLDARRVARKRWWSWGKEGDKPPQEVAPAKVKRPWLSVWNEQLWTPLR